MSKPLPITFARPTRAGPAGGRVRLLASVMSADEARVAIAGGADIIDAKDARSGALGALEDSVLAEIRAAVPVSITLSATTGDVPVSDPERVVGEMLRIAASGVDFVKIGFFCDAPAAPLIATLQRRADPDAHAFGRRIAVLLADRGPDLGLIEDLPRAGFRGVMLDTADKSSGSLFDVMAANDVSTFIRRAQSAGLLVGLAGALRLRHIDKVRALGPDIVGLRGALCRDVLRSGEIDGSAVATVRRQLDGE